MPQYVCDDCDAVFDSKEALAAHGCDVDDGRDLRSRLVEAVSWVRGLTRKQLFTLIGVILMSTLFMGTAFFYSSIAPGAGASDGTIDRSEPDPPVGYTIRSQGDIPDVPRSAVPDRPVSTEQLSHDVQLSLLVPGGVNNGPAVLLQYSCTDCPDTVDRLSRTAQRYNDGTRTWVFVAPYRDMEQRIAMTAFQRSRKIDRFNRTMVDSFICTSLQNQPVECAVNAVS